jgi:hypothetical protein
MRIALKVSSSNEYSDGGCDFALMDLTPELSTLALRRIATLREQKSLDPDIDETYYWAYFVDCYFSPNADLAIGEKVVEGASVAVGDMLNDLHIEEKEVVCVPDSFEVLPSQIATVECEQMIVRQDSIAFMAIPKHASYRVQTVEIPLALLEAAAGANALSTHV